jgi:hypothetical protein
MLSRPQYVMSKLERMDCTHNTNNCINQVIARSIELLVTISILEIAVLAVWTASHVKVAFLASKDVWMRSVASLHQKNTNICFRSFEAQLRMPQKVSRMLSSCVCDCNICWM